MKKLVFLFIMLFALNSNYAKAQAQGTVEVHNNTTCDIYWDVFAKCDNPCKLYSTQMMNLLAPGSPYPSVYGPVAPFDYPWGEEPECWNWSWAGAYITLTGDDGCVETVLVGVGNDCNGNPYPTQKTTTCKCNGETRTVTISIDPATGNIVVFIV
jgi:hypothetical protein